MTELPFPHSPEGASAASRFIKCLASVTLSEGIHDDESDYSVVGTAAHALGEVCLEFQSDAWEFIGYELENGKTWFPPEGLERAIEGVPVDKDMADAVQVYLDFIRRMFPDRQQDTFFIERKFHCPSLHKLFYGTCDAAAIALEQRRLDVVDYKHGAGVVVEVQWNEQTMYYACGMLEDLGLWDKVDMVYLHIVQPRGFHFDGPIREWSISVAKLKEWLYGVLLPAMDKAPVSRDTASGDHCRFCPARSRACPQLMSDLMEFEEIMALLKPDAEGKLTADPLSNEQLARMFELADPVKIALSAANKTIFQRLNAGIAIPGTKLAKARANREFRESRTVKTNAGELTVTLEDAMIEKFGDEAYQDVKLKSPSMVDTLPGGNAFTAAWAFKPDNGLTVVADDDNRPAVSKDTKSMFEAATKARKK